MTLLYLTFCFLFLFSGSALAYIDPASTSYVIQIVAAVFAAGGAAVGIYWKKIQLFFRKRKQKKAGRAAIRGAEGGEGGRSHAGVSRLFLPRRQPRAPDPLYGSPALIRSKAGGPFLCLYRREKRAGPLSFRAAPQAQKIQRSNERKVANGELA